MKYEPQIIWTSSMTEAYSIALKKYRISEEGQKQEEEFMKKLVGNIKVAGRDV